MATIQVRTEEKTKRSAMHILDKLGLDLSTAINIYLVQIIEKNGIPFPVVTENGFTPAQEIEILKDIEFAEKHSKKFKTAKALHKAILSE